MAVVIAGSLASGLTCLVVQAPRHRRSAGERRQQLKWLYTGAVVFVISVFLPGQVGNDLIGPLGTAALPVCIGVALKYRLFEIDRIISRVISYAIVTAVLAGVFAGLVLLATAALPFRTTVGVAVATLAAAALFNPLRKRVQHAVDRRFNRARYNADLTVAAFASRLKDAVDLDSVREDLATSGLPGLRQATIRPTTPSGVNTHHGAPQLPALTLKRARPASGHPAAVRASTRLPRATSKAGGDASPKRRDPGLAAA